GPLAPVVDLLTRLFTAARDKRGQPVTPGWLSCWLVPQIEAPAHLIAQVAQRRVHRQAVHEERAAPLHLHRDPVRCPNDFGDPQVEHLPRLAGAMQQQPTLVALWNDAKAA